MRFIEEAARLLRDAQSKRKNEERGRLDLQRREVEALERIADGLPRDGNDRDR